MYAYKNPLDVEYPSHLTLLDVNVSADAGEQQQQQQVEQHQRRGGYGVVFKLEDPITKETFALKCIPDWCKKSTNPIKDARKAAREVAILSMLTESLLLKINNRTNETAAAKNNNNKNLNDDHDYDDDDDVSSNYIIPLCRAYFSKDGKDLYLLMPFVEYDLRSVARGSFIPEDRIKFIIWQILAGVKLCHDKNFLHRDVTPGNVLMDEYCNVYLADFGLCRSKKPDDEDGSLDVTTLPYRSPELLLLCQKYNDRVDVWSIGCIFAELYLRDFLFKSERNDTQHFMRKIVLELGIRPDFELLKFYFESIHDDAKENKNDQSSNNNSSSLADRMYLNLQKAVLNEIDSYFDRQEEEENQQKKQEKNESSNDYFRNERPFEHLKKRLNLHYNSNPELHTKISDEAFDLMTQMLQVDFRKRCSAEEALKHPWFANDPYYPNFSSPSFPCDETVNGDEDDKDGNIATATISPMILMGSRQHSRSSENNNEENTKYSSCHQHSRMGSRQVSSFQDGPDYVSKLQNASNKDDESSPSSTRNLEEASKTTPAILAVAPQQPCSAKMDSSDEHPMNSTIKPTIKKCEIENEHEDAESTRAAVAPVVPPKHWMKFLDDLVSSGEEREKNTPKDEEEDDHDFAGESNDSLIKLQKIKKLSKMKLFLTHLIKYQDFKIRQGDDNYNFELTSNRVK